MCFGLYSIGYWSYSNNNSLLPSYFLKVFPGCVASLRLPGYQIIYISFLFSKICFQAYISATRKLINLLIFHCIVNVAPPSSRDMLMFLLFKRILFVFLRFQILFCLLNSVTLPLYQCFGTGKLHTIFMKVLAFSLI